MLFKVISRVSGISNSIKNQAYLLTDDWDDWFEFETKYWLIVIDENGEQHHIGAVKIGQVNMSQRRPELPRSFTEIGDDFFSLGQDDSYYDDLNKLGDTIRDEILSSLNDLAKNLTLFGKALKEKVTKVSLLRGVNPTTVQGQFNRIANGGSRLFKYDFKYVAPKNKNSSLPPIELSFHVEPESNPPTNIHVLIGRNGVGKTHLINNMINSLIDNSLSTKFGIFSSQQRNTKQLFANLVSVTFSAFDESHPLPERKDKTDGIQYSYVGLKRIKQENKLKLPPKSPTLLKNEFVKSVESCRKGAKNIRWKKALEILEADPIFKEAQVANVADEKNEEEFNKNISYLFKNLSSGHKIVLLTITRLVETVEEQTLVLIDEPEAHLHPPLLSAFMGALSYLLIQRNGVAIIATHSPVVLQEVPSSCVWKLRRMGHEAAIERLETESFGENVGALTREVFGLEVTHSGFHKLLIDKVRDRDINEDYDSIVEQFNEQLGMEARAILRSLLATPKIQ